MPGHFQRVKTQYTGGVFDEDIGDGADNLGQLQLEVQEATVEFIGMEVNVMQVADVAEAVPGLQLLTGDIRGALNENLTRAISGVNENISNMGGQLQDVRVGPDGIQISLSSTK